MIWDDEMGSPLLEKVLVKIKHLRLAALGCLWCMSEIEYIALICLGKNYSSVIFTLICLCMDYFSIIF